MVTVQMMVSSDTRRKRSTTCSALLTAMPLSRAPAPLDAIQPRLWKFFVSTTSVSPSQCARASPIHCRMLSSANGLSRNGMIRASWIISCWMTKWSGVCRKR